MTKPTPTASQPLAGLEVIELSTMVTCSLASMTMATQGASVIKVEPPDVGDPMRLLGTQKNAVSSLFHNCNRGKRSLAIDLKSPAGVEAVKKLAARADILLHNYRPGVMDRIGLGSDVLRQLNPRLIYVAVTGFGTTGPMADSPAYDHAIQGLAGFTNLQGYDDQDYDYMRTLICDKITGYTVAQAATSALLARATTGLGQHIDISMLHACLAFLWPDGMMHKTLLDNDVLHRSPMSDYYQTLDFSDGSLAIAPLYDRHWQVLLPLIGYPELVDDPLYASMPARSMAMRKVAEVLKKPRLDIGVDKALAALTAADVPCAPCVHRDDLIGQQQIEAIGALETYVTKLLGKVTVPTPPVQFAGIPTSYRQPSPALGQHSRSILQSLGWNQQQLDKLIADGTVTETPV